MTTGILPGCGRRCDTCRAAAALIFCRPHAAFLCGTCDSNLHPNPCHERVWVCEVCEQAPASVTCKADAAALCAACDRDIHAANPLAGRHERVPVVPFFHSVADASVRPSEFLAADKVAGSGILPPPVKQIIDDDHDVADGWLIPHPKSKFLMTDFLCNDSDLLDSEKFGGNDEYESQSFAAYTDSIVPTKTESNLCFSDHIFENCFDIDFSQPNKHQKLNNHQQIFSTSNYSSQPSASSSGVGVVPDTTATGDGVLSSANGAPAPAMNREARVLRYREKRKNRKFEKTIRYASRKAYAETRPRIKGRFVKRVNKTDRSEIDQTFGFGTGTGSPRFVPENIGFGVVPLFV